MAMRKEEEKFKTNETLAGKRKTKANEVQEQKEGRKEGTENRRKLPIKEKKIKIE